MKKKLHPDLDALFAFFQKQRQNPPAEYSHGKGIVNQPDIFTLAQLQNLLNNPLLSPEWLNLVVRGDDTSLEPALFYKTVQKKRLMFIDKTFIDHHLANGAAIVLEGLDILDSRINSFLAKVDAAFPCVLSNCVVFFSQTDNEAYQGHCDTDDVLVFQTQGKKVWQLFAPQQRRYFDASNLSDERLGPVQQELTMRPGDALYLRAGVPHRCLTPGDYSLHLSFDLGDRTPNVEQISAEADRVYRHATAPAYGPASQVVEKYVQIMKDSEFQHALRRETENKREKIQQFRQQIGQTSAIRYIGKLK